MHVAPGRRLPVKSVDGVVAEEGRGLVGDRYHGSKHRHVTIQSQEQLDEAAVKLGHAFDCAGTRRNVTVDSGVIPTKPGTRLRVGDVELEVIRHSAPCRLLDDDIGPGAMRALSGLTGSVCRILGSGTIRVGDPVEIGTEPPASRSPQ
ncbi:MAG: MOSC domain-containing protein [Mycobacterium sp.]